MKVHHGMTSDRIVKLFGNPKNISQAVCGAKYGESWSCTTWEYGEFPYDRAVFTFNSNVNPMALNDFDIDIQGDGSLPETFTSENVMKVRPGTRSKEILKVFGAPKSVSQSVCGAGTGKTWICTTWEYGDFPYQRANFTFSGEPATLILNDFKVDKD